MCIAAFYVASDHIATDSVAPFWTVTPKAYIMGLLDSEQIPVSEIDWGCVWLL